MSRRAALIGLLIAALVLTAWAFQQTRPPAPVAPAVIPANAPSAKTLAQPSAAAAVASTPSNGSSPVQSHADADAVAAWRRAQDCPTAREEPDSHLLAGLNNAERATHADAYAQALHRQRLRCPGPALLTADNDRVLAQLGHQAAVAGDPLATLLDLSAAPGDRDRTQPLIDAFLQALTSTDPARWQTLSDAERNLAWADRPLLPRGANSELIWNLVGCDLGLDCGAGSAALDRLCLDLEACAYPNVESAIVDALWAQGDVDRFQQARRQLAERIRRGELSPIFEPWMTAPGPGRP
jgi:hypothetical protein